jgi:DNA-binding response OmpR family regulator
MASGHDVVLARTIEDGLTLARDRKPDLAVVHLSEGSRDGIALLEILRHDPDTRKTGVLIVAEAVDRERAMAAGANEFLSRPISPAALREACVRVVEESGQDNARRVLIVDDDPTIRVICREVLERSGYSVQDVGDGRSALSAAKGFRPDLMLLDVMMPEMDGFTTAERFRAEAPTSMTPIIFLSARGETTDKVRAFRSGAEDYVVKPFDAAELVARVGKALDRHAREVGASPTTQLPGALSIEQEIDRRLENGGDYAFCYLDLDNLKAFNDYYGYAKADGIIRQTGDLIRDVVSRVGDDTDFIGHIAGDDFVLFTTAARVDSVCRTICETFDRLVPLYYNKVDRERGFIETKDRYGELRKFPVMTVSIAVVTLRSGICGIADLAAAAAKGKTLAKAVAGSSYVRDGGVVMGAPPQPADVVA